MGGQFIPYLPPNVVVVNIHHRLLGLAFPPRVSDIREWLAENRAKSDVITTSAPFKVPGWRFAGQTPTATLGRGADTAGLGYSLGQRSRRQGVYKRLLPASWKHRNRDSNLTTFYTIACRLLWCMQRSGKCFSYIKRLFNCRRVVIIN